MIRRLAAIFLTITLTLAAALPVSAHHYIYLAEDPEVQEDDWQGIENMVFWRWAWDGSALRWWAQEGYFKSDVAEVFQRYYAIVPLPYDPPVANRGDADLTLEEKTVPCGNPDAEACYVPDNFTYHSEMRASYIAHAYIEIRSNLPYEYRIAAIAHELGHFYGLHDRYVDNGGEPGSPNPSELSIMDAGLDDSLLNGPSLVDQGRLKAFWGKSDLVYENGQYNNTWYKGDIAITGTAYRDNETGQYIAIFSWRDLAWGEQAHAVGFYYSANGTIWELNPFLSRNHTTDVGLQFYLGGDRVDLGDVTLQESIYPRSYKPAGYFKMCGAPFFIRLPGTPPEGEWGSFRCSNAVYIP